jgi:hypothetical protein
MNVRHIVLVAALAATLAAVFWPQQEQEEELATVEPARHAAPAAATATQTVSARPATPAAASGSREFAAPRFTPEMTADLFPSQTWVPPPPPPPKPLPPPPPEPPPLPFKYLGRWAEADGEVIFLTHGNGVLRIRGGEVLPGGWRVDEITKGRVLFTYQPLNMQKTLGFAP